MSTTATPAGPTGAAPAGAGPDAAVVDVEGLVYHTVIFLLALVALLVLLRIPRAFARLWRTSEWTQGHFLGYEPFTGSSSPISFTTPGPGPYTTGFSKDMGSEDSHTSHHAANKDFRVTTKARTSPSSYPPHLEPTPSFLRPVVSLLRSRVSPGISVSQIVVLAGYLATLLYPASYRSAGPFTDIDRYGHIAVSQIPFIFAFGSKNNVLGMFLGVGYEKLNFLHRFVARLAIISAHLHGFGYIYSWCLAKDFMEKIVRPEHYFGLITLLCFDCLLLFSTAYVRKNAYNFFLFSHILFLHAILVCAQFHYPALLPYIYCSIAIYGLDRLMRMAKSRISTARIRPIPELGLTRIELPGINKGWRAGQHVRIQILSTTMGITGWAEPHPFTIASHTNSQEGLVLLCKKSGAWTQKLYAVAATSRSEAGIGRDIKIMVEGPYGGPGFAMFNSYSAALFVVGGSGITFALSAVQELIQQDLRGESRVKVIELIWAVQDAVSLAPFIPQFTTMIQQCAFAHLTISVHYTKAIVGNLRINNGVHPGLSLNAGRPRLLNAIESIVSRTVNSGTIVQNEKCGLLVGVCGPVSLGDDVSKAVGVVDPAKRDEIGGIEIHEEYVNIALTPPRLANRDALGCLVGRMA
ncbi:hypothetical protein B0H10DRAFT_1846647 [Mycena sp. CBHHK59/15]|nr:hypothetical protein B0H10DRAFT_1846647 [Mycena sp. CBHHK59/15]